ncbi:MAG: class I SAM-dependent methyltransferase [Planctomycetota bacterium]
MTDEAPIGLYADPVVYDVLHAPGTADEFRTLELIADRFVTPSGRERTWLEPACGTGRLLRHAARQGIRVIGIDLAPEMIKDAKRRLPSLSRVQWHVGDMTDFAGIVTRSSVDLAFCTINTARHLGADEQSDRPMLQHLEQIAAVLKPGGVYVLGISLTAYGFEPPSEDVWSGSRGSLRVKQVVQYEPATKASRREMVISVLDIERPRGCETRSSSYALRSYDRKQWDRLVARSAMQVVGVVDEFGDDTPVLAPGYQLFILKPR